MMADAWACFALKVEHNDLRKQCGLKPVYLTDEQTRRAHNALVGEVKLATVQAQEIPNDA